MLGSQKEEIEKYLVFQKLMVFWERQSIQPAKFHDRGDTEAVEGSYKQHSFQNQNKTRFPQSSTLTLFLTSYPFPAQLNYTLSYPAAARGAPDWDKLIWKTVSRRRMEDGSVMGHAVAKRISLVPPLKLQSNSWGRSLGPRETLRQWEL